MNLPPLRTFASPDKRAAAFGFDPENVALLANLNQAGWQAIILPPMVEVYPWILKAAKHRDAVGFLMPMVQVSIYTQLTISEAMSFARNVREVMPHADNPALRPEWATWGMQVLSVWEARKRSGWLGVGDEWRSSEELEALNRWLAGARYAELQAEAAKLAARLAPPSEQIGAQS